MAKHLFKSVEIAAQNPAHGWEREASDLRSRFTYEDTDVRVTGGFQQIDELLSKTFKPTQEIPTLKRDKAFFVALGSVTEIFVPGHSLAQVDKLYSKAVLENVNSNAHWIVSFRSDGAKAWTAVNDIDLPSSKICIERLIDL